MHHPTTPPPHYLARARRRKGVVLLLVVIVIAVLALAAYQFSDMMSSESKAADSYNRAAQARALADSGIDYAAAALSNPDTFTNTLNSNPYHNPQAFQGVLVHAHDQPRFRGRFSIVAPLGPDDAASDMLPYRFGAVDECGKINLNALMKIDSSGQIAHDMLMMLPNMTEDIANSILDWLDPDDTSRPNGAETDYYSTLSPPYRAKNAPLDSLEELLLVKGMTPQLLFGNDRNHNGILDPDEDDGSGTLDLGWSAYLTIYSRESNLDSSGNPRIYVNDKDLDTLYQNLNTAVGPDLASYIVAYRLYGPATSQSRPGGAPMKSSPQSTGTQAPSNSGTRPAGGNTAEAGSSGGSRASPSRLTRGNLGNLGQGQPRSISSLYELINSQVSIPGDTPQSPPTIYPSPLNDAGSLRQLLPPLLDKVTTVRGADLPGRINLNTAPRAVLSSLPKLTDADVQSILAHRPSPSDTSAPDPIYQTPTWLITEANINPKTLQSLDRYITARSQVYRVQALGYFDGGGPVTRVEAVIDTNGGRPRVVFWRDLTELGKGFDLQSSP